MTKRWVGGHVRANWLKNAWNHYMYIPRAPMTSIIEGQPPQNKAFSDQNKSHLGSRYTHMLRFIYMRCILVIYKLKAIPNSWHKYKLISCSPADIQILRITSWFCLSAALTSFLFTPCNPWTCEQGSMFYKHWDSFWPARTYGSKTCCVIVMYSYSSYRMPPSGYANPLKPQAACSRLSWLPSRKYSDGICGGGGKLWPRVMDEGYLDDQFGNLMHPPWN